MALLRFAPSPTGALHLGGLRTALYNYLYAKKHGGKWIMRIEDTDVTRYVPGSVDNIRKALEWAGLEYDYGPGKDGPHAPYFQSERLDLYRSYTNKLLDSGHAYRCFCSPDRLTTTREKLARSGSNETYDKHCLYLSDEEVARKVRAGEKSVVRLNDDKLPNRPPSVDIVFGKLRDSHLSLPTDPILLKSDLFPTYHLASVVDDHEMGITHVLRGEEWLPSLDLHLDIYACFNIPSPQFAHIPILVNADGSKMSKRNGDVQVADYIRRGWEPAAILNWLALAGWGAQREVTEVSSGPSGSPRSVQSSPAPDSTTVMTMPEMIEQFDLPALTHRSTSLDPTKLEYLNKHHLMRVWSTPEGLDSLAHRLHGLVKEAFPASPFTTVDYIKKIILILQGRLTNVQDIGLHTPYLFIEPDYSSDEAQAMIKNIPEESRQRTLHAVRDRLNDSTQWDTIDIAGILHEENDSLGLSHKNFMTTLRHTLSAMKNGPSVPEIMQVLGRERTLARLQNHITSAADKTD
ncbi:Glutamate--tRNA ligase mitochondrial [Pleurotus pulmonarius]|nr:Glutamate--tRNA ligase mitochondrial [Pleurotus pulmonarius]